MVFDHHNLFDERNSVIRDKKF